jgi:hypothetical protein
MGRKKYSCLILIFAISISCTNLDNHYYEALSGEWQIEKLLHEDKDYSLKDTYIMTFSSPNKLWLRNINHKNEISLNSKYKISKNNANYEIDISDCSDNNINGNYNIFMDTIRDDGESYQILLTLDSEKTYIQAIRYKLKFNSYDEYVKNTAK